MLAHLWDRLRAALALSHHLLHRLHLGVRHRSCRFRCRCCCCCCSFLLALLARRQVLNWQGIRERRSCGAEPKCSQLPHLRATGTATAPRATRRSVFSGNIYPLTLGQCISASRGREMESKRLHSTVHGPGACSSSIGALPSSPARRYHVRTSWARQASDLALTVKTVGLWQSRQGNCKHDRGTAQARRPQA